MRKTEEAESIPIPVVVEEAIVNPKRQPKWRCFVKDCMRDVVVDANFTLFDDRYATGTCQTHGHVPLVRVP